MTIIVTCLDAAMSSSDVKTIIVGIMMRLFQEEALNVEYLEHEIPQHVEGWRSTGITRNMVPKARHTWADLERKGSHLPGYIPSGDAEELVRFLYWLVVGVAKTFSTASSDTFSLAKLLQEMGFDLLRTGLPTDSFDEAFTVVIFDPSHIAAAAPGKVSNRLRSGMRVPLATMDECMSVWPDSPSTNNKRRKMFQDGMLLGSKLNFEVIVEAMMMSEGPGIMWKITERPGNNSKQERADPDGYRLANKFLLLQTSDAVRACAKVIDSWKLSTSARQEMSMKLENFELDRHVGLTREATDLQIFLLGYYYAALAQVLDTAQLSYKEAFGSWDWAPMESLEMFASLAGCPTSTTKTNSRGGGLKEQETLSVTCDRYHVLKLAAYLFAGAEKEQIKLISRDTMGVLAKLVLLCPGLIGNVDSLESLAKIHLMDIDPTSIPSNAHGLAQPGKQEQCSPGPPSSQLSDFQATLGKVVDFTSHIEPSWGFDPNLCLLAYRHKGRLVFRASPSNIELAAASLCQDNLHRSNIQVLPSTRRDPKQTTFDQVSQPGVLDSMRHKWNFHFAKLSDFYDGHKVVLLGSQEPGGIQQALLIPTRGLKNARACITTMYSIGPCLFGAGNYTPDDGEDVPEPVAELAEFFWDGLFPRALIFRAPGYTGDSLYVVMPQ
jgi:hypothetical protein